MHSSLDVLTVEKQTVEVAHPDIEQGHLFHTFLCDIASGARNTGVGENNVKITPVISNIEHWRVRRNIFFADIVYLHAGEKTHAAECPVYNCQTRTALGIGVRLAEQPFHQHDRGAQN